MSNKKYFEKIF